MKKNYIFLALTRFTSTAFSGTGQSRDPALSTPQRRERKGEAFSSVLVEPLSSRKKKVTRSHVAIGLHEQASFNERRVKVRELWITIYNCTACEGYGGELPSIL